MTRARTLLIALLSFATYYAEPLVPRVSVVPSTEQSIKQEMRREQREKQYARAAAVAAQIYRRNGCVTDYAYPTGRMAVDFGLSPRVFAALVFIESSCNPRAVSRTHDVGLTQIHLHTWGYRYEDLLNPETNLKAGAFVLAKYVHQFGLVEGLHHYNGLGNPTNEYAKKVLTAAGLSVMVS